MPQTHVYDSDPNQNGTPFHNLVKGFVEAEKSQRENDALANIYEQYKNEGKSLEDAFVNLHRNPRISPTARVAAASNLKSLHETNATLQAATQKKQEEQAKVTKQEAADKAEVEAILDTIEGISPEQKKNLAGKLTPVSARALIKQEEKSADVDYKKAENIHKIRAKDIEATGEAAKQAESKLPAINAGIKTNEQYGTSEKIFDTIIESTGSRLLAPLKSLSGQKLETAIPGAIGSFAPQMGGLLTNNKLAIIEKKAVGLGKDKNANRMLLYMDKYDKDIDIIRNRITKQLLSENEYGLADRNFDIELEKRLLPYQKMANKDIDTLLNNQIPDSPMSYDPLGENKYSFDFRGPPPDNEIYEVTYSKVPEAIKRGLQYVGPHGK